MHESITEGVIPLADLHECSLERALVIEVLEDNTPAMKYTELKREAVSSAAAAVLNRMQAAVERGAELTS